MRSKIYSKSRPVIQTDRMGWLDDVLPVELYFRQISAMINVGFNAGGYKPIRAYTQRVVRQVINSVMFILPVSSPTVIVMSMGRSPMRVLPKACPILYMTVTLEKGYNPFRSVQTI